MNEKLGGFTIHAKNRQKQKGESSQQINRGKHVLVRYKEIESVCSCSNDEIGSNYMKYVRPIDKHKSSDLTKRTTLDSILKELPSYFVQINKGEILNIFHIEEMTKDYLYTKLNAYRVTKGFKEKVNKELEKNFHFSK